MLCLTGSRKNTRNTKDSQGKGKETDDIRRKVRLKRRKEGKKKKKKITKGERWSEKGVTFPFSSTNHQRRPTTGLPVGQDC